MSPAITRLGHGPAEQRRRRGEAGGIALGDDAAVIDHDDGAHAGTCEGVVGEDAIERIGWWRRCCRRARAAVCACGQDDRRRRGRWSEAAVAVAMWRAGQGDAGVRGGIEVAVGHDGAAYAGARHGKAVADEAEQTGAHHPCSRSTETRMRREQRDARCLHVDAQHFFRVAAGEKHIGADDLGGVVGADPQNVGRLEPQREAAAARAAR